MMKLALISYCILLIHLSFAQETSVNEVAQARWDAAVAAFNAGDFEASGRLYRLLLEQAEREGNQTALLNCLEALALVAYEQAEYEEAARLCRRIFALGAPTFRAFYVQAYVSAQHFNDRDTALRYCRQGLRQFPGNEHLKALLSDLENMVEQTPIYSTQASKPAPDVAEIDQDEYRIVTEMNHARQNPKDYLKKLLALRQYYDGNLLRLPDRVPLRTEEGRSALEEAIAYVRELRPIGKLDVSQGMSLAALDHVNDQSVSGATGHIGADGSTPAKRIERYGEWLSVCGENIAYGDDSAEMFVLQLIIDDGVPNRGHREAIFNPEFKICGVSIGTHPVFRAMCVTTFAGGFRRGP